MSAHKPSLLKISSVTKRYGETTVLNNCRLDVRAGEIHALLGGNGAGKSTLVRIISGLVPPTKCHMEFQEKSYAPSNKREAEQYGVEIVQQELNLIPTLSVAENILLTRMPNRAGVIRYGQLHQMAKQALERLGLNDIPTTALVGSLGVGQQQMVEIAAALDRDCKLLILDEPTATLSISETEALFEWLNKLRERGVGLIYISHRLDEVARLADRITVLRDGEYVGTYSAQGVSTEEMVHLMSGETQQVSASQSKTLPSQQNQQSSIAMQVEGISGGIVQNVHFNVNRGERLGIAGLVGSGRTELLRLIFGADVASAGHLKLFDDPTPHRFHHPSEAVKAGLAMVTEDRKENGLLLTQSIRTNSTLAAMIRKFSQAGLIHHRAESESTNAHCNTMETRRSSIEQPVGTLSGGNQQKVVIAKWLTVDASIFLFDEPTRGIDVPARRRIYHLMDQLAQQGKAVVIVSSDIEELLETCDRIAVMSNGQLVESFTGSEMTKDQITQAAFSGYLDRQTTA